MVWITAIAPSRATRGACKDLALGSTARITRRFLVQIQAQVLNFFPLTLKAPIAGGSLVELFSIFII